MVLEFGLLNTNLFPSTEAAGEGFNPDTNQIPNKARHQAHSCHG